MLHRFTRTAALLGALLASGCRSKSEAGEGTRSKPTEVVSAIDAGPPATDAQKLSEAHGAKWAPDDDEGGTKQGGFSMYKEAWVYVDGMPVGVLREAELPTLPETWVDEVEYLDFNAGDKGPRERVFQVRRWKLADYLESIGLNLKKVKAILLHGGRGTALIPGDDFRRTKDKLLFDLTGNTALKLRVFLPDELELNTSFDRYAAVSVIVDKPMVTTDEDNNVVLDGVEVVGIPFYGQPLRGGIRVYLDGKLAVIIKRNSLGDEGRVEPGKDGWSVAKLLDAREVDTSKIAAADLLDPASVATRIDAAALQALTFTTSSQAQGAIVLSNGQLTNAILLWTKGKVPGPRVPTPNERDKK